MPRRTPEQNARRRAEYALNRDKINERRRAMRDPEKNRAEQRAKYWKDPEKSRAQRRAWHARHREEAGERRRNKPPQDREQANAQKRLYRARSRHGMWPEDWAALWEAQGGRCYLCGDGLADDTRLVHVDHDHSCCPRNYSCGMCRRGLTCNRCNQAIGLAGDDPDRMERMAANLRAAKLLVVQRMVGRSEQLAMIG